MLHYPTLGRNVFAPARREREGRTILFDAPMLSGIWSRLARAKASMFNAAFRLIPLVMPLIGMTAALPAGAQEYPSKLVRIIVPVPPGGIVDNATRAIADRLGVRLGQQVVMDNRPGANGTIGAQVVAQSASDGYTLLSAVDGTMVVSLNPQIFPARSLDTLRDFAPITKLGDAALLLVSHPSVPAKNLAEFIKVARAKPDAFSYGTSGLGSTPHLSGELLNQRAGLRLTHVPYKGGGQALIDAMGGQIPLVFTTVASAQQYVKTGKLTGLGVSSAKRSAALPNTPTFIQGGVPGFDVSAWVGVFAPAKTPRAVVDKLRQEIAAVLTEEPVRASYGTLGIEPVGNTPEQFAQQIRVDLERWARVVKEAKITLE